MDILDTIANNLKTKIETLTSCKEAVTAYLIDQRSDIDLQDNLYSLTLGSCKIEPFSNIREQVTQDFIVTFSSVFLNENIDGDTDRRAIVKSLEAKAQVLAVALTRQYKSLHNQVIGLEASSAEIEFFPKANTAAVKLRLPIKFLRKGN
jgi:hypothetical protein